MVSELDDRLIVSYQNFIKMITSIRPKWPILLFFAFMNFVHPLPQNPSNFPIFNPISQLYDLSNFWSILWNRTLPRPLTKNQFHEIVLKFQENFLNYEHDLEILTAEVERLHRNKSSK